MDSSDTLIASIIEEDRLLQDLLARCGEGSREERGPGGTLSFKETLGHLAFWDEFAVRFFLQRLGDAADHPVLPADFERRSREELQKIRALPFSRVLDRYLHATRDLIDFLRGHWHELSIKEREDFHIPLKHRRHHRLLLAKALALPPRRDLRQKSEKA